MLLYCGLVGIYHIINIMWYFLCGITNKTQTLYLPGMNSSCFSCVYACSVYVTMP